MSRNEPTDSGSAIQGDAQRSAPDGAGPLVARPDLAELPDASESMALASRAREGDRQALEELLARHEPWLRRVARIELGAHLRRQMDSLDLVQEVAAIAFLRIGDLRLTDAPSVRRWLRSILGYRLRDLARKLTAEKRDVRREVPLRGPRPWDATSSGAADPSAHTTRPDERVEKLEMRELLDELVSELPEGQRAVVLLRDYDHADWTRIRDELEKPTIGAVQQLHQRAWATILERASRRVKPC